ncbi:MAG: hydrolase, partial [Candidatus Heimdallarchaeota archaeon]|nr:hydrolase [Candidatus Heimdallarchaeota archaeon]MCK4253858.1 hydrolase [Candidatus Heimdallarchaeota archaeon]
MYSTIILHANLQYAEIPVDEIPNVVEQSYIPVLSLLLEIPNIAVVLNFTGVTLEILHNEYPEVIELLKKGIKKE